MGIQEISMENLSKEIYGYIYILYIYIWIGCMFLLGKKYGPRIKHLKDIYIYIQLYIYIIES